jgi:hypothetical protein
MNHIGGMRKDREEGGGRKRRGERQRQRQYERGWHEV